MIRASKDVDIVRTVKSDELYPVKEITIIKPMPTVWEYYKEIYDSKMAQEALIDLKYYSPSLFYRWVKEGKIKENGRRLVDEPNNLG